MSLKTIVFCLFVILLVDFVCETQALDQNGEGVCVVKLSSRQRRKRPYNVAINKWCGRSKCVVKKYRFETYLTWTNHTVCCNGWQHDSELDICEAICSTGCIGGRCVSPDQCQCEAPAHIDPERPNTCITPTCNPTCFNAICHANNTCICKDTFTPYNSTHCFKCDEGYTADENLNCVPICNETCINSSCTAPNTCTCSDGYKPKNSSVCEPICDCVNGYCVAPNTCSCLKGYVPINETVCAPKCNNCAHGDCIAPNNCSCHSGYVKIKGVCKPKCSKSCVNSFCTAPNVCSCKNGYVKSDSSDNVCVIPCDRNCMGYCDDGGCVKWNCSSTPIRAKGKDAGKTIRRSVCCANYEYDADEDKCLPICHQGCIKGMCTDVDVCTCTPPLTLVGHTCVPSTCDNCEHGDCVAPNDCRCHKGYSKINDNKTCTPICEKLCVNGKCAAPNECECNTGFKRDPIDKSICNPICDPQCINGTCTGHNNCTCNVGYEPTKINSVCKPSCFGCEFGQCVAPNHCSCFKGYERINSTCIPKCSSCSDGDCVAPETCKCHKGYEMKKGETVCMPVCSSPCTNGKCIAPDQCTCNDGYNMTGTSCQPYCMTPCTNGKCSAPNSCNCFDGYVKDDIDHSICRKHCHPKCTNGTCSLDGECKCYKDFEFNNDTKTCTPVKPIDCDLCGGRCSEDRGCRCANETICTLGSVEMPAGVVADDVNLAGMSFTLIGIGSACLLLLILVVVVMQQLYRKMNKYDENKANNQNPTFGSVEYNHIAANTLIYPRTSERNFNNEGSGEEDVTDDTALRTDAQLP